VLLGLVRGVPEELKGVPEGYGASIDVAALVVLTLLKDDDGDGEVLQKLAMLRPR